MGLISPEELRAMQGLAQEVWRRESTHVDVTLGELAYTWGVRNADFAHEWLHRLWNEGDRCTGWGWLFLPGTLEWQVHPDRQYLLDEVLDWSEAASPGVQLETTVRAGHEAAIACLERRGFVRDEDARGRSCSCAI